MWASIIAVLSAIPAIAEILKIFRDAIKAVLPSTSEQIEADKKKMREEIAKADETGRP
jgi:phage tail protein X